ncbi:hypothetical protein D3C72_1040310 [compost metagenome]
MKARPKIVIHRRMDAAGHQQVHAAHRLLFGLRHVAEQLRHACVYGQRGLAHLFAGPRDGELGVMPFDQPAVQLRFQAAQGLADRRLRQVQLDSSTANAALFCNHQKSTKKIPIQPFTHARKSGGRHGFFCHGMLIGKGCWAALGECSHSRRWSISTLILLKSVIRKRKLTPGEGAGDKAPGTAISFTLKDTSWTTQCRPRR